MADNIVTIGLVTQPTSKIKSYTPFGTDYVPASYVDWVSLAGARPVVIPWDIPEHELKALMKRTNGLLLPGGPQDLDQTQPYYERVKAYYCKVKWLYDSVIDINKETYFPLWGTCQGFEQIILSATDFGKELCWNCFKGMWDVALPLNFTCKAATSRMFTSSGIPALDQRVLQILSNRQRPVTPNFHFSGIAPDTFRNSSALGIFQD